MRARIAVKHPPGEGEHGWRNVRERVGPFLASQPTFVHGWWLEDNTHQTVSMTLWSDEDLEQHEVDLRAVPLLPGLEASMLRGPDDRAFLDVVAAWGLDHSGAQAARLARFAAEERAAESKWVRDHLLPALRQTRGFHTLVLGEDAARRIVSLSLWADASAVETGQMAVAALGRDQRLPHPYQVECFNVVHEVSGTRTPSRGGQ